MTKLYCAGPISGYKDWNFPAFFTATRELKNAGYAVVNPARRPAGDEGKTWEMYLREALVDLLACDAVATLRGWEASRGATLEVQVARALSMPVMNVRAWSNLARWGVSL